MSKINRVNILAVFVAFMIFSRATLDLLREFRVPVGGFDLNFNVIFFLIVLSLNILLLLGRVIRKDYEIPKINIIIIFMLCYFTTSLFYSYDQQGTVQELFRLITIIGICPVVYEVINNEKDLKRFLHSFAYSSVIPIFYGFFQYLFMKNTLNYYDAYFRLIGTFNHPSAYGDFLVLMSLFFMGFYFYFREQKQFKKGRRMFLFFGLLALSLVMTFTRGSWIGFVIASLFMVFLKSKRLFMRYLGLLIVGLLVLSPVLIPRFSGELSNQGVQVVDVGGVNVTGSYASRLSFTLYALKNMFLEAPIFGKGLGSFFYHFAPIVFNIQVEAHNDFAKLLGETGIVGGLTYIFLYFYLIFSSRSLFKKESDPKRKTIFLIMFSMSIFMLYSGLTNASLRLLPVQFYFWSFIGLSFSLIKFRYKEKVLTE